jgi:hypothetical protein
VTENQKRRFVIAHLKQKIAKLKGELEGRARYQASMKFPSLWFLKAWELKYSSDALHRCESRNRKKTFSYLSQELLLLGFAFELLFKSFYIAEHGSLSRGAKTHNLHELVRLAHVSLQASDLKLLRRLSKVVWWQGRYPCALKPAESNADKFSNADVRSLRKLWRACCKQTPDAIGTEILDTIRSMKRLRSRG